MRIEMVVFPVWMIMSSLLMYWILETVLALNDPIIELAFLTSLLFYYYEECR